MVRILLARGANAILVLAAISLAAFAVSRFLGDPVLVMLGPDHTPAQYEQAVRDLGLDRSVLYQYGQYLLRILEGNWGVSYRFNQPVTELLAIRMPATVELASVAMVLSILIGIPAGVYVALRPNSIEGGLLSVLMLFAVSLPTFMIGSALLLVFSVELMWTPAFGRGDTVELWNGWTTGLLTSSGRLSIILPALTLSFYQTAVIMRLVRVQMTKTLRSDFIRFARARGIHPVRIVFHYALKATLVPVVTFIGMQFGGLIAFGIVTETVFQWPGMGQLLVESIAVADIPVISTYLVLIGAIFVTVNLVVDLLYAKLDPRIQTRASS
ncbi:MAG: ABC transporter permease [Rhizobium pusense]|nr:ABC transporter permease [Agrobacterium pusense]